MIDTKLHGRSLATDFPALAYTLGQARFDGLADQALAAADATGSPAGEWLLRMLVSFDIRTEGIPSRLSADVAALEWAIAQVHATPAPTHAPMLRRDVPDDAHSRPGAMLVPIDALRIVPVAFRLDAYLRRIAAGRRPQAPARGDQVVVVYRPAGRVHRIALSSGEGRLLQHLRLGVPVTDAVAAAVANGSAIDVGSARRDIDFWLGEGLFSQVLSP